MKLKTSGPIRGLTKKARQGLLMISILLMFSQASQASPVLYDFIFLSLKNPTKQLITLDAYHFPTGYFMYATDRIEPNKNFKALFVGRINLKDPEISPLKDFEIFFKSKNRISRYGWSYLNIHSRTDPAYSDTENFNLILNQSQPRFFLNHSIRATYLKGHFWDNEDKNP